MADNDFYLDDDTSTFEASNSFESAGRILKALEHSKKVFRDWQDKCDIIDRYYSLQGNLDGILLGLGMTDITLDLFWASTEVLKPAIYARAPKPVVSPMFNDNRQLKVVTAELLERVSYSTLARTDIQDVMTDIRDDLIFTNRGVMWLTYEGDADRKNQKVCVESVDRRDFLHDVARKWCEVGWVAKRSWLTRKEMENRFKSTKEAWAGRAKFSDAYNDTTDSDNRDVNGNDVHSGKCGVWEVWHKADDKVYWVTEGCPKLLDSGEPHIDLQDFFPCPRPAYGTLERRSLIPVPDWERYQIHFNQISEMTGRIYSLIRAAKMAGFYRGGGDIGDAVEVAMNDPADLTLIPIPSLDGADAVVWIQLAEIGNTVSALLNARTQLINDYYQLSGISDIMRGASEANETLGAQRIKTQFANIRVQSKVDELQRIAADAVKIASEVVSEKFSEKNLQDMAQMSLPTRSEIKKQIKEIENAAKEELKAAKVKADAAAQEAQMQGQDPAQVAQMFNEAQGQIIGKYQPMLAQVEQLVPIEDVVDLLRDDRSRSFAFEIESDSTILTDEMQEKQSRSDFLSAFSGAQQSVMQVAAAGEAGAKLAGEILKFTLSPFRVGRTMNTAIDEFVKEMPALAAKMGEGQDDGMAEATAKLAEAETMKAQAQMAKVEADAANKQAEMQRKMGEAQQAAQKAQMDMELEVAKLQQQAQDAEVKAQEAWAKIDLIKAQTLKTLTEANIATNRQNLDEFRSLADIEFREADMVERQVDREVAQVNRQEDLAVKQFDKQEDRAFGRQDRAEERDFQREQSARLPGAE